MAPLSEERIAHRIRSIVLSRGQDKALVLDLERRRQVGEIALASRPETGVSVDAGRKLYVALSASERLAVIEIAARRRVRMIAGVGERPWDGSSVGALSQCHCGSAGGPLTGAERRPRWRRSAPPP